MSGKVKWTFKEKSVSNKIDRKTLMKVAFVKQNLIWTYRAGGFFSGGKLHVEGLFLISKLESRFYLLMSVCTSST